ncbi:hypothetical protein C1H76_3876 [Elsinoe australis]|uniref:Uncharacterized protein n=1 Tax=Elsinoe australis TaxID=40998 RepID=A0A4U7AYX6_9PEZI|nr:hypothetical protein C1H76_3876 [Elsinoe australis]
MCQQIAAYYEDCPHTTGSLKRCERAVREGRDCNDEERHVAMPGTLLWPGSLRCFKGKCDVCSKDEAGAARAREKQERKEVEERKRKRDKDEEDEKSRKKSRGSSSKSGDKASSSK